MVLRIFILHLTVTLFFISNLEARQYLKPNPIIAEAIQVYQLYLENKTKSEIEAIIGSSIEVNNVHQALDHVIYLTNRSERENLGGQEFASCRDQLIPSSFDRFIESYGEINYQIQQQFSDMWKYQFDEKVGCDICLGNDACYQSNEIWQRQFLSTNIEYASYQDEAQRIACSEMSKLAYNQATEGVAIDGGTKIECQPGHYCINFNPYWSNIYSYDFTQCREDFLVCPRIEHENLYIHPSCYHGLHGTIAMADFYKKITWLNEQADSIVAHCDGFPIEMGDQFKANERPQLFNCLPNSGEISREGLINIDPTSIAQFNYSAPQLSYRTLMQTNVKTQASRFDVENINLLKQIKDLDLAIGTLEEQLRSNSISNYDWKLRTFVSSRKNNATLSQAEYDVLRTQITQKKSEREQLILRKKALASTELESIPEQLQSSKYAETLRQLANSAIYEANIPYYEDSKMLDIELITTDKPTEYTISTSDQQTLANLVKEKIKIMILSNSRERKRSLESVNMLASAWTAQCMENKLHDLGCFPKNYNTAPFCVNCPERLTSAQQDLANKHRFQSRSEYRSNFYRQRRCSDYVEDFNTIKPNLINSQIHGHICSDSLSVSSRIFEKTRPKVCTPNQP